jgi:hypothetical protein
LREREREEMGLRFLRATSNKQRPKEQDEEANKEDTCT